MADVIIYDDNIYVVFYNKMYMSLSLTLCDVVINCRFCLSTHSNRIAECILLCCIHRPIYFFLHWCSPIPGFKNNNMRYESF